MPRHSMSHRKTFAKRFVPLSLTKNTPGPPNISNSAGNQKPAQRRLTDGIDEQRRPSGSDKLVTQTVQGRPVPYRSRTQ